MKKILMGEETFSQLSIGFWRIAESGLTTTEIKDLLIELKELGIDTIDTAQVYGMQAHHAEEILGDVFKTYPELKNDFKIVTKTGIPRSDFGHYNQGYEFIIESCNNSLKALNIECIDVYLLHRPDVFVDLEDAYKAIKQLMDEGKIKQIGVSNYTPIAFDSLNTYFGKRNISLVTNQIEMNLFSEEHITNDNIFYLKGHEITPMIWSPVGGGKITEAPQEVIEIAKKYDLTPAGLSYAYLACTGLKPHIILGSFKVERYVEAIKGINTKIEYKDMYKLLKVSTGVDVK